MYVYCEWFSSEMQPHSVTDKENEAQKMRIGWSVVATGNFFQPIACKGTI